MNIGGTCDACIQLVDGVCSCHNALRACIGVQFKSGSVAAACAIASSVTMETCHDAGVLDDLPFDADLASILEGQQDTDRDPQMIPGPWHEHVDPSMENDPTRDTALEDVLDACMQEPNRVQCSSRKRVVLRVTSGGSSASTDEWLAEPVRSQQDPAWDAMSQEYFNNNSRGVDYPNYAMPGEARPGNPQLPREADAAPGKPACGRELPLVEDELMTQTINVARVPRVDYPCGSQPDLQEAAPSTPPRGLAPNKCMRSPRHTTPKTPIRRRLRRSDKWWADKAERQ